MTYLPLVLVLTFLIACPASASAVAPDLRHAEFHAPTALDTLRDDARLARIRGDRTAADALLARILALNPNDGFALAEVAEAAWVRDELHLLSDELARGDRHRVPGGAGLDEAGVAFLLGLVEYARDRYRSAIPSFDKAAAGRPGDGWVSLYRGLCRRQLLEPSASWSPELESAIRDPEAAPAVIRKILFTSDDWDESTLVAADGYLPKLAAVPWASEIPDYRAAVVALGVHRFSAAQYDSLWDSFTRRNGERVEDLSRLLWSPLQLDLTPAELTRFLDRCGDAGRLSALGDLRTTLLDDLGYSDRAESLAVAWIPEDPQMLRSALRLGTYTRSAEWLSAGADRLILSSLWYYDVELVTQLYGDVGRREEAEATRRLFHEQCPLAAAQRRLEVLSASDPVGARALADSLTALGLPDDALGRVRFDLLPRESRISPDTYRQARFRAEAAWSAMSVVEGEQAAGRSSDVTALEAWAREAMRNCMRFARTDLDRAVEGHDSSGCARALESLERLAPGAPVTIESRVRASAYLGRTEEARELLAEAVPLVTGAPGTAMRLVFTASGLEETAQARRLLEIGREGAPESRQVRIVGAWLDVQEHRNDPARQVLEELVREFPGRESYRTLLISAGGGAQSMAGFQPPASTDGDDFAGFGHDLESVDWILAAIAETDTLRGIDAVYLSRRTSYVAPSTRDLRCRNREVLRILGPEAIERYQPKRIAFQPATGVPRVVQARVIHPDGSIVPVKAADIVVAGSESEADVSDELQLVIPFRGLGVGDVIDVTWEKSVIALISVGWSIRELFAAEVPTWQQTLEIESRPECHVYQNAGTPTVEEVRVEGAVRRTWTRKGLSILVYEGMSGSLYDSNPWIGLTCSASWPEAAENTRTSFWKQVAVSDSVRALALEWTRGKKTPYDKVEALRAGLTGRVKYLAVELGLGAVVPSPPAEVLGRGYGDCKDMVTTMLALLGAAGIDGRPVLVTTGGLGATVRPDFVDASAFGHVIVEVPALGQRAWCDPTSGAPAGLLSPLIGDTWGLALNKAGPAELVRIPAADPADHGFAIETTLQPVSGGDAEISVTGRFRGELGLYLRAALGLADTTSVSAVVDRSLAYGFPESCRRQSWRVLKVEPAAITISAVYRDTAWSAEDQSSVAAILNTEVADPFLLYPPVTGRKTDVRIDYPFECDYVLHLKGGAGWEVVDDIVLVAVQGEHYRGGIEKKSDEGGPEAGITVHQHFVMDHRDVPVAKYKRFFDDWFRFSAGVAQPYTFRRSLSAAERVRMTSYASAHPDDYGFAVQAAQKILGSDLGGEGKAGNERRQVAGGLLEGAARITDSGSTPLLLLSAIRMQEGKYREADSLLTVAGTREPSNMYVKAVQIATKEELSDVTGQVRLLDDLIRDTGNEKILLRKITVLYRSRQEPSARQVEEQYFALHGAEDSTDVQGARLSGYLEAKSCPEARKLLTEMAGLGSAEERRSWQDMLNLQCASNAEALHLLESLWSEQPLNAFVCNDLAWRYALMGIELDRAEELVLSATILAKNDASTQNTLGAIYARRGEWERARQVFQAILDREERPRHRIVNEYFVGLCEYQAGRKTQAVDRWDRAMAIAPYEYEWLDRIQRSLELARTNDDVTRAIFDAAP